MKRIVSGILLKLLLISISTLLAFDIQPATASGPVYIRADGSIDPPTAPISTIDNITYTLTDSIQSDGNGIVVERDNIVVDGAGYTVRGGIDQIVQKGIFLSERSNVTIKNMEIREFDVGVDLYYSLNNCIVGNTITNNTFYGIYLYESSNNTISGNNIAHPHEYAYVCIFLSYSSNNSIVENNITNSEGAYGFWLEWSHNNTFYHNNLINVGCHVCFRIDAEGNIWDNGYPSGGNYWGPVRPYSGVDFFKGQLQNEAGSDGLGDTPLHLWYGYSDADHYPLMKPYHGPHDIGAIMVVSKTVLGEEYNTTVYINVKIINYGEQMETFNFTFQTLSATLEEEELELASRDSLTFTFEWNTTGFVKGNYTINAHVTQVSGETDTTDNTNVKWIVITIPGDVTSANGQPDGKVDMRDIGVLCNNFMIKPSSPNYDINNDGVVNMRDIGIACNNFGKT